MGRTTIARDLIEAIKLGAVKKEEILRHLTDASDGAERLRSGKPALTVRFFGLHKARVAPRIARGTQFPPALPVYTPVAQVQMYSLTDAARVDVLRFGRHPDQDVQLLDREVSREHGLVIYADKLPLYCDYGTLIGGVHAGSTNGTYVDGQVRIRDAMITWLPGHELTLGGRDPESADPDASGTYRFKLTYELHKPGPDTN